MLGRDDPDFTFGNTVLCRSSFDERKPLAEFEDQRTQMLLDNAHLGDASIATP